MSFPSETPFAVLGAGPAGLTATFELARRGHQPLVLERSGYLGASRARPGGTATGLISAGIASLRRATP